MILLALKAVAYLFLGLLAVSYILHWVFIAMKKWTGDLNIGFIDLLPAILLGPIMILLIFLLKFRNMNLRGLYRLATNPFYETKTAKEINRLIYLHSGDNNDLREKVLATKITLKQYEDLVRDYDYQNEERPLVSEIAGILKDRERVAMK